MILSHKSPLAAVYAFVQDGENLGAVLNLQAHCRLIQEINFLDTLLVEEFWNELVPYSAFTQEENHNLPQVYRVAAVAI